MSELDRLCEVAGLAYVDALQRGADPVRAVVLAARPDLDAERILEAAGDRLNERVRTVHERAACPVCGAPVGEVCRNAIDGHRLLKHPHTARLRADGIPLR